MTFSSRLIVTVVIRFSWGFAQPSQCICLGRHSLIIGHKEWGGGQNQFAPHYNPITTYSLAFVRHTPLFGFFFCLISKKGCEPISQEHLVSMINFRLGT